MDDNKKMILIIAVCIALLLIFVTYLLIAKARLSPKQGDLASCKTLYYHGEDKINLVLFGNAENAKKYSDFLLSTKPFDKTNFNFYYIDNYEPECSIYQKIALLCYSKDLVRKAASCPNDYIVVLDDKHRDLRSSSYMNVMSINMAHPLTVLTHEFGHAFANFAEEYVPATIPAKSQNCAAKCDEFGDEKNGCFEGCSKAEYFRSVDAGVMRTLLSNDYGIFNKNLILQKLKENNAGISGMAVGEVRSCQSEKYVLIEGNYNSGKVDIIDKKLERGCVGGNGAGSFDYRILMDDNSVIKNGEFNPELIFTDSPGDFEIVGEDFENKGQFLLKLPVIKGSRALEIINANNNETTEVNLKDVGARPCRV